jgi:hypothetical protein
MQKFSVTYIQKMEMLAPVVVLAVVKVVLVSLID